MVTVSCAVKLTDERSVACPCAPTVTHAEPAGIRETLKLPSSSVRTPDAAPATATKASKMGSPEAPSKTVPVNVSVDPEADSRGGVSHFMQTIGWARYGGYYLSAPKPRLQPVWRAYGIYVPAPKPDKGGDPIHTAAVAMIDQSGNVRGFFSYPFRPSYLARGARDLLKQRV